MRVRLSAQEQQDAILVRLREGPLSCFDAEHDFHRGQASVNQLVKKGYEIPVVRIGVENHYVLEGVIDVVKVTRSMKNAYYASGHWRVTAWERKDLDGMTCRQCGSRADLETHHWRYNLFAESVEFDLMTFCAECHRRIHEAISRSSCHFPHFVIPEMAVRIEAGR